MFSWNTMGGTAEAKEGGIGLSQDECFDLLSNHRRRYILHYLRTNGGETSLSELAGTVAAWENDVDPDAVSYDQRKRVYTSLQQVHLPRMDEMDVVDFDDREGAVVLGPAAGDLDVYLDVVEGREVTWSLVYLLPALVNGGLLVGVAAGLPLLTGVPAVGWAVFVAATFLVMSLARVYLTRTEVGFGEGSPPDRRRR